MLRPASSCAGSSQASGQGRPRVALAAAALSHHGPGPEQAQQRPTRRLTRRTTTSTGSSEGHATYGEQSVLQPVQPAHRYLGTQLLQQPEQPILTRTPLGTMLLQQPRVDRRQQHQQQQQRQVVQAQQHHQQQQQAVQGPGHQLQAEQPQLSSRANQPRAPEALTPAGGFQLTRHFTYMTPEAVDPQQLWIPPELQQLEAQVAALPPKRLAAEVERAKASSTGLLPALRTEGRSYTGSYPKLFFALQAMVAERQAVSEPVVEAPHSSSGGGSSSSSSSSSSSGSIPTSGKLQESFIMGRRRRRSTTVTEGSSSCSGGRSKSRQVSADIHSPLPADVQGSGSRTYIDGSSSTPNSSSSSSSLDSRPRGTRSINAAGSASAAPNTAAPQHAFVQPGHHAHSDASTAGSVAAAAAASAAAQTEPLQLVQSSRGSRPSSSSTNPATQRYSQPCHQPATSSAGWQTEQELLLRVQERLLEHGFEPLPRLHVGKQRPMCPECEGGSSAENSLLLRVNQSGYVTWKCFRATCSWQGSFYLPGRWRRRSSSSSSSTNDSSWGSSRTVTERVGGVSAEPVLPASVAPHKAAELLPLSNSLVDWFQSERGISSSALQRSRVSMVQPSPQREPIIAFPYYWGDVLVNIKYRSLEKSFWQVQNGQQVFYGLNDLQGASAAIIVEGEMDKLALDTALDHPDDAGTAVLSLPAGAVPQGNPDPRSRKLACVDAAAGQLSQLQHIIIAVDGDAPGQATAEALRLKLKSLQCSSQQPGATRESQQLWLLPWPTAPGGEATLTRAAAEAAQHGIEVDLAAASSCKDANDVLRVCGFAFLQVFVGQAHKL